MTNQQKWQVQFGIDYAMKRILEIEAGDDDLHDKWDRMDNQLLLLLDDLVAVVPRPWRAQVQACLDRRNRIREARYEEMGLPVFEQQKTSPECLAASDSF